MTELTLSQRTLQLPGDDRFQRHVRIMRELLDKLPSQSVRLAISSVLQRLRETQ